MTYIPGTGSQDGRQVVPKKQMRMEGDLITVVNVSEIKKSKTERLLGLEEKEVWYLRLYAWVLFGSIPSLFFILLSFWNKMFLILVLMGPIFGFISWFVRRIAIKYEEKLDFFAKTKPST